MPKKVRLIVAAVVGGLLIAASVTTAAGAMIRGGTAPPTVTNTTVVRTTHTALPPTVASGSIVRTPQTAAPSGITAKGAYLYDVNRAKDLWGVATTTERPIGSITKMMTAMVVIRSGNLDQTVTIKQSYVDHVTSNDASSAGLRAGDKLTVRQLLNAMMLPSGCDAAYALGDVYGPGQTDFVAKMNSTAASLGMTQTHYLNADGLPTSTGQEGYSTPHDLILLARNALANTDFRSVVGHQTYTLASTSTHHAYNWTNTNLLLGSYSGTIGIKTGHTNAAGYSLVFAATRGDRTLIGVVLNSTTTDANRRFADGAAMLDWGFGIKNRFTLRSLPAGMATD